MPAQQPGEPAWQATELLQRQMPGRGNALPTGSHLGEFELLRVLGEGGFGIVYLAHDHSLQRRVAIKEYMPASLAMRGGGLSVVVTAEKNRGIFESGLESFVNEARLLAQFDHPSLVKVYRFWRDNGTAYMVMPFYEGATLKERLRQFGTPPDERWLMALLASLTEALAVIHAEHCLHRDIAPDNILLLADSGRPLLLDFGAARQVIGDATQALTAILKPGYAPVEQYAEVPSLKQGPWTDIYALCAVVYAASTGGKPPVSVGRTVADSYVPLVQCAAGRYSARFLAASDAGLEVRPDGRPASVQALRQALGLGVQSVDANLGVPLPLVAVAAAATPEPAPARHVATPAPVMPQVSAAPRRSLVFGGGLAALALAAAAFWAGQRQQASIGATPPIAAASPPTSTAPGLAPQAVVEGATAARPSPVNTGATAFSIPSEFDRVMQGRQTDFQVQASANTPQLRIGKDRLGFKVSAARSGYVYVLVGGPDGSLLLLYPNSKTPDSRIRAGQTLSLPQANWPLDTAEPTGAEDFAVIVSEHPRDFSHLSQERVAWFLQLPTGAAGFALAQGHQGPGSVMAGKARCSSVGCDRYGAARFSVNVVN